jgi:hypothetical protein
MTRIESFNKHLAGPSDKTATADSVLDALEATLTEEQDYHRLFDAKLMRVRRRLNLPLTQPTSLASVPPELDSAFRDAYMAVAREIGTLFLKQNQLSDAWAYFRTIGEPGPVRNALEAMTVPSEPGPERDELLNLALYEGAHVVLGLRMLISSNGTCNTITAMGQLMQQMTPEERNQAAAMMVRHLYGDLQYSLRRHIEAREPKTELQLPIGQLIEGRRWLFEEGNYHIDISHLHSTVGFARHLKQSDPELTLAIELSQYGSQLDAPLRYPGEVPFDDFYLGHTHFLRAIAGTGADEALQYFHQRLQQEEDPQNQKMIAFVIVDLGQRIGRSAEALELAGQHLSRMEDPGGFSWSAACINAGRKDLLTAAAQQNDDVLSYALSLLS